MNPPEILITMLAVAAYGVAAVSLGCQLRNRRNIVALTERIDRIDDAVGAALTEIKSGARQEHKTNLGRFL